VLSRAIPGQEPDIAAFLEPYASTSMFLRGNLERHGVTQSDHPHATAFYLWRTEKVIRAVFGVTNAGFLMAQVPDVSPVAIHRFAAAIQGTRVRGMTGDARQVPRVLDALGLSTAHWQLCRDDPLYALCLRDMADIPTSGHLRRPEDVDIPLLTHWFCHYDIDAGVAEPGEDLRRRAADRAKAAVGTPDLRLLVRDGMPVAMTQFNARAADMVQVGGVFVPRDLRRQGLGRQVVAAHLREARHAGTTDAILFAANPAAARAYEAIGFNRIGDYRIALLSQPVVLGQPIVPLAPAPSGPQV
jgi:GNAT superfamily N-acetyltransferase